MVIQVLNFKLGITLRVSVASATVNLIRFRSHKIGDILREGRGLKQQKFFSYQYCNMVLWQYSTFTPSRYSQIVLV